ncbi:MAG: hypothetical protein KKC20_24730 [Proteobacteria bacterium]|nr:hypothetical protein [Pseudomonadota bacterium]
MQNRVFIEGIVAKAYKYKNDLFLRLACYRDPREPIKRNAEGRDEPDYISVRLTNAVPKLITYEVGLHLRIEGLLQSREYQENLDEYLGRSNVQKLPNRPSVEIIGGNGREITAERNLLEVLAENIVVIFEKMSPVSEDGTTISVPDERKPDLSTTNKLSVHAETKPQSKPVVPPVQPKPVNQKNQPKPAQQNNKPKPQAANNQPKQPIAGQGKNKK